MEQELFDILILATIFNTSRQNKDSLSSKIEAFGVFKKKFTSTTCLNGTWIPYRQFRQSNKKKCWTKKVYSPNVKWRGHRDVRRSRCDCEKGNWWVTIWKRNAGKQLPSVTKQQLETSLLRPEKKKVKRRSGRRPRVGAGGCGLGF